MLKISLPAFNLHSRVIFLGPPGSGKGTQAPLIRQLFRLAHLSTGDMLRDAVARDTAHGKKAKALMDEGHLVNDEIVVDIVQDAIRADDCKRGFILDGFPRTVRQAELLDEMLSHHNHAIDCVISLTVDDELLVQRVTGRLIHPPSGRSYHPLFNPPKCEGLDDVTNEPLVKRDDDTEEKLRTRLHAFHEKTAPVLQHYKDKVVQVPADDGVQQIGERVREALGRIAQQKMGEY
ncbi:adenylate kinase [archaeon]|nr:MAG: adenylate kinase [archaeon]